MAGPANILGGRSIDALLFNLESLKQYPEISNVVTAYLDGDYKAVLRSPTSQTLFQKFAKTILLSREQQCSEFQDGTLEGDVNLVLILLTGLAAFNAFLQANVTGPPLDFGGVFTVDGDQSIFKDRCLKSLEMDGISVYQYIPLVDFFCLARMVFTICFPRIVNVNFRDCKWMRIRINAFHQRLLSGSSGGKLSDFTVLQDLIEKDLTAFGAEILGEQSKYTTEAKVQFLLEKAQVYIMQGMDYKAKDNLRLAKTISGFSYALSGALGKRTKFQQNDISQLVVFAKSKQSDDNLIESLSGKLENGSLSSSIKKEEESSAPQALDLNDDTLLESIKFTKTASEKIDSSALPPELTGMLPDEQPQLKPLDQIMLLTEATLKDSLSPLDKLNSEEILPYAVRVLSDKPTNWQIYTQALLVRSRIESHRSRTQERSVLQLQVIVDQIIADTQETSTSPDGIPQIQVTQFLPRAKITESAPVYERLKYISQLCTPTRWEIETELAYAWSSAGSLVSALEIFKRLRLWAEVALCYHSVDQEDKARQIVRRQLYYSSRGVQMDKYSIDSPEVITEKWEGEMRSPPPPHSPRLWCILGDLDQDPTCWERAWELSKNRYARAQRTLGEYYTRHSDLEKARAAYMKATIVNRQNNETWSRLGDIDLAVGNWDGAVIAFQQSIMIDDTDAKTYSNLGSALLTKYSELISLEKVSASNHPSSKNEEGEEDFSADIKETEQRPKEILHQALIAYKRGASLAHDNWKIWDNVITIALRTSPPSFPEIIMGTKAILRIRGPTLGEAAVDTDVLGILISEVTSGERSGGEEKEGIYYPPRGSLARAVIEMLDSSIIPLITTRFMLWSLISKLAIWRRDFGAALEYAEKGWRGCMSGEVWLESKERWEEVVGMTEDLVSAYENFGGERWRTKARSAVRGVMGKGRDTWEGSKGWETLEGLVEELKNG
ncbi:hypothetical protein B7494_g87 [Chlorociboria aeruginascens]|nr:hypothetical protein B7494_g87 [Chlorociboria aeruginascens]